MSRVLVSVPLLLCGFAAATYPVDRGAIANVVFDLGGKWSLSNGSSTLSAQVPGDLITDLENGGVIGDPLYEFNFKNAVWDMGNWTYTKTFDAPASLIAAPTRWLVFEGNKMVSEAYLNGVFLGFTADQFLRYSFDVSSALKATGNVLTVVFTQFNDPRNSEERWMSCSGGWDWAPYSDTSFEGRCTTFSKGMWRPVYLLGINAGSAAISHVAPRVFYDGAYPQTPLSDGAHGDFHVNVDVYFTAPEATTGTLTATGAWPGGTAAAVPVTLPAGNSSARVVLPAKNNAVALWWPANTPGAQNLYNVSVTFTPDGAGGAPLSDARRIGFRVFTLVTGNDTDPSTLAGKDGQTHFTMRFKVNGADVWSRGANMIPVEEMEGRTSAENLRRLVQSAAEGGFNTFRLWGGGIFQYDAWYDACDEFGIMIYHDMMFAQGNHAPSATPTQSAEILYQVRRLAEHPSIAVWDGCNECDGHGIYADFVMTTVAGEDASRPPWPSCPANGWNSGVDALWGLPNGSPLGLKPRLAKPEPAPPLPVVGGPCEAQALTVARAMGCPGGTAGCTFVPNQDYDQGSMGPSASAPDAATCCTLCAARPDCEAATYVPGTCWFKTKAQTQVPGYNRDATGCWPPGHTPPPPSPPPPPSCAGLSYETHGYYQHGEGWRSVNSGGGLQPFDPNLPPGMPGPALTGTGCPGTYASEFGAVAISSWESMNPTLAPADWGLHNAAMSQRNYAVDNFVTAFANIPWPSGFDGVAGKAPFQKFLYFAMLGQALWIKSDIEGRRAQNSFGCVTWQFNEIWPTGGWGSIEYGTVGFTPGQVEGGRWKPLQYFMRRFIYRDHLIAAANDGRVLVRSDDAFGTTSATAAVSLLHVATGAVTPLGSGPVALPRGAAATTWLCTDGATAAGRVCPTLQSVLPGAGCAADGSDCVLLLNLTTTGGVFVVDNFELLAPLWKVQLPPATVTAAVGAPAADGTVPITLTASATALFVHLTTLAQGRFSDNSLILLPGNTVVSFLPWGPLDVGLLTTSLRVEHVKMYGVNGTAAV